MRSTTNWAERASATSVKATARLVAAFTVASLGLLLLTIVDVRRGFLLPATAYAKVGAPSVLLDLNELARARNTQHVVFPCYASSLTGLECGDNVLYLDRALELKAPLNEVTLVGCDLSKRIFTSLYGAEPAFIDMCPKNMLRDVSGACLCRCCIVDEGHLIEGNAAFVPWGASVGEVEEAIIDLFGLELG